MKMRSLVITAILLAFAAGSAAFEIDDPDFILDEVIFEMQAGELFSPRAVKQAGPPPQYFDGHPPGWSQTDGDAYAEFNPAEIFPTEKGSLEIELVVMDGKNLAGLCDELESLVTIYDASGTAFFSVGINATEVSVGSFPLHPAEMEEAYGGVSFLYGHLLDGALKDGDELTVCIAWGPEPSGNRVYVNGTLIDKEHITGPRNMGPPGFEPTRTLASYMNGFRTSDGIDVGPPARFVVGRIGTPDKNDPLGMSLPRSVAIKRIKAGNINLCE